MSTYQIGTHLQTQIPEGACNLSAGQPSPRLLPMELVAHAAARRLHKDADRLLLQYGANAGGGPFREALAGFLSREFRLPIPSDSVLVSGGISGALPLLFGAFAQRSKAVVTEDPTYFLARDIFIAAGAEVTGIPVDAEGLQVEVLESELRSGHLRPALLYTIPTHQNPTSACLSDKRKRRLIELAEEFDFTIVADEPYNFLSFDQPAAPPLAALDEGRGRVVSLGSFSKIFGPGLRLGWIHAAPQVIEQLAKQGVLASGGGLNPLVSEIVLETLIDGSLSRHIAMLRQVLGARRLALVSALRRFIPDVQFAVPQGGYFLWAQLPQGVDAPALWEFAKRDSVAFLPGTRCSLGGAHRDRARLSFSFYEEEELPGCVERLASVVAQYRAQHG